MVESAASERMGACTGGHGRFRNTGPVVAAGLGPHRVGACRRGQYVAGGSHPPETGQDGHNGALSPFMTCVGLVYGALLGFTIVVAWEQFSSAEANVSNEASTLTTMYRQTVGMPVSEQAQMRRLLRTYTSAVAGPEWEKAVRAGGGTEG